MSQALNPTGSPAQPPPLLAGDLPWQRRFRLPRHTLPAWAKENTDRCVFVSDVSGVTEVYCWDRVTGRVRQVTDRPNGTRHCAVTASGEWAWWFADTDGDEFGGWMKQPFAGGPDTPVAPELEPAWMSGLAMDLHGHALLGRSTEEGTAIHLVHDGRPPRLVYQHEETATAVDLSRDLQLVAIEHSEGGDAWRMAVRVLRLDGSVVADLQDEGQGLAAVGFSPVVGDRRLLLLHQLRGHWAPLVFDPETGDRFETEVGLPGDLEVDWFLDASALLVHHIHHARSELYRYDLGTRELTTLPTPPGTVEDARARPDGSVWYIWSSAASPPRFTSTSHEPGLSIGPPVAELDSVPVTDAWVDGPGGRIHTLVSVPPWADLPCPTVVLLHGGPDEHDTDQFEPEVAAWLDHGFAVVRPNYRGSTGYGTDWTEALRQQVGFTELEDVAAARRWAIEAGVADPKRLVLAGSSWGGYLTLLGLALQPESWSVGLADSPVADCIAAYEDAMDDIKALDRALFGGTPDEVRERYLASSPLTYVPFIRSPVLVSAGINDPRCPIRQIENFVSRLGELGLPHELHRRLSGHASTVVEE